MTACCRWVAGRSKCQFELTSARTIGLRARVGAWHIEYPKSPDLSALKQLIADLNADDVVLIGELGVLTNVSADPWHRLCHRVEHDSVSLVAIDLPGSRAALTAV